MDALSDRACDEVRREEPVTLEGPGSLEISTTLLHKKTEKPTPTEATRPLALASLVSQDALPDRPLADIARVKHDELLILDTTGYQLLPRTHELPLHTEDQSPATGAIDTSSGSPRSMPRDRLPATTTDATRRAHRERCRRLARPPVVRTHCSDSHFRKTRVSH